MIKFKIYGIFLILIILLSGCSSKTPQEATGTDSNINNSNFDNDDDIVPNKEGTGKDPESISFDYDKNYSLEEIPAPDVEIGAPSGICVFNDILVVCDKKNSCLVLLDKDCNFIKKIGNLGMGPLEFTEPTGITVFNNNLYILDAGNNRIQILDSAYKYIDEIPLNEFIHKSEYIDLSVDKNGIIYVSTYASVQTEAHIFRVENKKIEELEQTFIGHLYSYNGTVYAVNIQELDQGGSTEWASNGKNYLYRIEDQKLVEIKELPYKYTPAGICIYNNKLYTSSGLWMRVDIFTMEGKLENPVTALPTTTMDRYLSVFDENHIYCTDLNRPSIFKITKAETK
ncbi:MAG: 6-bladed beta-propeller [Anaerocolumna sp.]